MSQPTTIRVGDQTTNITVTPTIGQSVELQCDHDTRLNNRTLQEVYSIHFKHTLCTYISVIYLLSA